MKKAQVTIFIVIGIIIVAGILSIFLLERQLFPTSSEKVPEKLSSFSESYSSCLQDLGKEAVQILGQRGGYIYLPEKEHASRYMPFGNYLEFLGDEIPYWFYISSNNIEKQQVPSIGSMENSIEKYVKENVNKCDNVIKEFSLQGFEIEKKSYVSARATIKDDDISLRITRPLNVKLQEIRAQVDVYNVGIAKSLGQVYKAAKKIMDAENEQLFLEERTIDAIFLYDEIPSTKTTLECNPRSFTFLEVKENAKEILANNIPFTKIKGTNYANANSYYEIDAGISNKQLGVNFLFIDEPFKLEINGQESGILKGDSISQVYPAGLRNFLCLSSYSFVYTMAYPVLVSVYDSNSDYTFQFPFMVFVNKNSPRKALETTTFTKEESEVCKYKLAEEEVYTFDSDVNPLEDVIISYKCINTICSIGTTSMQNDKAVLKANFPQCINGFIIAEKQGYARIKEQVSTNVDGQTINLILEPFTELNVELILIDNFAGERQLKSDETAIISFIEEDKEISEILMYPENKKVNLVDGFYSIRIDIFKDSKLSIEDQSVEKCFKVPSSAVGGIAGILGFKKEKCETFEFPSMEINQILFAGSQFSFHAQVAGKNKIKLYAIENPIPKDIDDMNEIYAGIIINKDSPLFKEPEVI